MIVNGEQRKVEKNDVIYVYAGSEQRIKNVGNTDLKYLVICAPPFSRDKSRVVE